MLPGGKYQSDASSSIQVKKRFLEFLVSFCKLLVAVVESVHSKGNVENPTFVGSLHLHLGSSKYHLFVPVTDVDRLREENTILSKWGTNMDYS